jgi:cytochrome c peroxidase
MKKRNYFILSLFVVIALASCKNNDGVDIEYDYYEKEDYQLLAQYLDIPEVPYAYENRFPDYYSTFPRTYDRDLATLGRVLFYDKNLSDDRTISCASCHRQEIAFSDNVALSNGVNGRKTTRNSLALGSVFNFQEYYGSSIIGRIPFFWDNRATSVQEQSRATLGNPDEMNMPMHEVRGRVEDLEYYEPLFRMAYGHTVQNDQEILDAIGVFVNSIGSFNSKYDQEVDKYLNQTGSLSNIENSDLSGFNAQENMGRQLFVNNCSNCHGNIERAAPTPGLIQANNGLRMNYEDEGVASFEPGAQNVAMFKVPTLRNIELTAPYMHDGSLATLEEVVDHYSNNIAAHPNLNPELKGLDGSPKQMNFSQEEKEALIAFLKTYTDDEFLTDERYSDPFKQ